MPDKRVVLHLFVQHKCMGHHNIVCSIYWLMTVERLHFQSIAGNIMTASPISDLNPLFLAARCQLTVSSKGVICLVGNCKEYRCRKNCILSVLLPLIYLRYFLQCKNHTEH